MTNNVHAQTFLWVGTPSSLIKEVITHLQKHFCPHNQCTRCTICLLIAHNEHPCVLQLKPQPTYTLETLKPFFGLISKTVDPNQTFFFIFEHADYLSTSCANSLLKSIEEPPPGFEIIFLAQNLQAVAPTLRSRCIVVQKNHEKNKEYSGLTEFFLPDKNYNAEAFLEFLQKQSIDEHVTIDALQFLLNTWSSSYKDLLLLEPQKAPLAEKKVQVINRACEKPLMPGSGKLFRVFLTK